MKFRSPGLSKTLDHRRQLRQLEKQRRELFCEGTAVRLNLRFLLERWPTVTASTWPD
jgi:hypothetical protein